MAARSCLCLSVCVPVSIFGIHFFFFFSLTLLRNDQLQPNWGHRCIEYRIKC